MTRPTAKFSLIPALLLLTSACDPDVASDGADFRSAIMDVNMRLIEADGGEEDGTILWEIVDVEIDGGEEDGTILWEIVDVEIDGDDERRSILWEVVETDGGEEDGTILWEIVDVEMSRTTCTVAGPYLRDASGAVLMTVAGNQLYSGEIPKKYLAKNYLHPFRKDLRFTLHGTEVWADAMDRRLLVADANLEWASDLRKLVIGALEAGLCR